MILQAERFREVLQVMKFSHAAASSFWRAIYMGGMWLSREVATDIVYNGWCTLVSQSGRSILWQYFW